MRDTLHSALAVGLVGVALAAPAGAIVIGNADTTAQDYISLATQPGFSHTDAFGTASFSLASSSVGGFLSISACRGTSPVSP